MGLRPILATAVLLAMSSGISAQPKDIVGTAVSAGSFTTLVKALQAAGLVDALQGDGPFTVFAPTDDAFAELPPEVLASLLKPENKARLASILTYHVVPGRVPASQVVTLRGAKTLNGQQVDIRVSKGIVQVDNATVITADIECSNGIVHVIDQVILPAAETIPTTAVKAGNFNTLVAAVTAAGLAEVLSSDGPFTVFAPTDEAFANLPEGTVETLLKPENKARLVSLLKYHVVPGRVYASDALAVGSANTLAGNAVRIAVKDGAAKVNDASLIATDIDASNGVIHVIDRVLSPPPNGAQSRAEEVRGIIATAINTGAPLYNAGHHDACAKLYMTTIDNVLAMENHGMSDATVHTLRVAMTNAKHNSNADRQAWTLRHALDAAYTNMGTVR